MVASTTPHTRSSIGADEYRNSSYNLNYAVGDVWGFAQAAERSGRQLFSEIATTLILNEEVTRERLIGAFEEISGQ